MLFKKKNRLESKGEKYLENKVREREEAEPLKLVLDFMTEKNFLKKERDLHQPDKVLWKFGDLGMKMRKNIIKYWKLQTTQKLNRIRYIEEINDRLSVDYLIDMFVKEDQTVPCGVSRIVTDEREDFSCNELIFKERHSDKLMLEYTAVPSTSKDMMISWTDFTMGFLEKLGIDSDDLETEYERYEDHPYSDHYYFDRFRIKNIYHFGTEVICTVSNKIDFEFEHHETRHFSDEARDKCFVTDEMRNTRSFPHVIEIKIDIDRLLLAVLLNNFHQERVRTSILRTVNLTPQIAPVKCAVFPLSIIDKKTRLLSEKIHEGLNRKFETRYDEKGTLDIRMAEYNEIGVPFYITADPELIGENLFTLRDNKFGTESSLFEEDIIQYIGSKISE